MKGILNRSQWFKGEVRVLVEGDIVPMLTFEPGVKYSRPEVKELAGLPRGSKGGNWDTGTGPLPLSLIGHLRSIAVVSHHGKTTFLQTNG